MSLIVPGTGNVASILGTAGRLLPFEVLLTAAVWLRVTQLQTADGPAPLALQALASLAAGPLSIAAWWLVHRDLPATAAPRQPVLVAALEYEYELAEPLDWSTRVGSA